MSLEKIQKQLADAGWTNKVIDPFINDRIMPFIENYVGDHEQVKSLGWTRETNEKGELSPIYILLILTNQRIIILSKNSMEKNSKIVEQWFGFDEIQYLNVESSAIHNDSARINLIAGRSGYALESIDKSSANHFVKNSLKLIAIQKKAETFVPSDSEKSSELTHMKTIKVEPQKAKTEKDSKISEYIFGYSSLVKSNPAMQIILAFVALIWMIFAASISGADASGKATKSVIDALGSVNIAISVIGLVVSIYYVINIWEKEKLKTHTIIGLMLSIGFLLLFVIAILQITEFGPWYIMTHIGIFTSLLMTSGTSILFLKDYKESIN